MTPPMCPMSQGAAGFRGPPVPLILVPVGIHLVRSSADPKMVAYLKEISKGGPIAIAENAHRVAQYALSKVPSNVLYWFTSRVLNLPPEIAMRTTEFLKSRTELEVPTEGESQEPLRIVQDGSAETALASTQGIERRLEKLERDYQVLQERHFESLRILTEKPEFVPVPREFALPASQDTPQQHIETASESLQLVKLEPVEITSLPSPQAGSGDAQILLQDVGLRLGRIFLEWAGDMMKQTLVTAAAKSSASPAFVDAGVDLAGRLVDAVMT